MYWAWPDNLTHDIGPRNGSCLSLGFSPHDKSTARVLGLRSYNQIECSTQSLLLGESFDQPVSVPPTQGDALFGIEWLGSQFQLELETPSGALVTESTADPNFQFTSGSTSAHFQVTDPEEGDWAMRVTAIDVPDEGEPVTLDASSAASRSDEDGDGVADVIDNCRASPNATQSDCNYNDVGDACESFETHDFNTDEVVDVSDFRAFLYCMTGPAGDKATWLPRCTDLCFGLFDSDGNGSVDLRDFGSFQAAFTSR